MKQKKSPKSKPVKSKPKAQPDSAGFWHLRNHPFVVPVLTFLVLFFVSMFAFIFLGGSTIGASDSKVVTVYIDGKKQVLPTRAQTVADLLQRMNITLNPHDIVEPATTAPILEDNFTVNVYRARAVTLVDGQKKVTLLSAQQSNRAIAREAGLPVQPEDIIVAKTGDSVLKDPTISQKLVIERATEVKLNLYGQLLDVRTHAKTVSDMLKERGVKSQDVSVFPAADTALTPGIVVFVTDPGKDVQLTETSIPQGTDYTDDYNLLAGQTEVRNLGKPGRKVIVYENPKGQPEQRKVLQEVLVDVPVNKLIARGRKINTAAVTGDKASIMAAAGISPNDYYAVDFIISHESHWRPGAINGSGCLGLGQACPGSKLIAVCPNWSADPACQLRFFGGYANRYGGWQGAYSFWVVNRWW